MIFDHGFFHGDPHPGNLMVGSDGKTIVLLDFGLAKQLPDRFADGAALMIVKAVAGDVAGAVAAASDIGFEVTGEPAAFADLMKLLMGDHSAVEGDALSVMAATSMKKVPSHFALIGRTFILLNGVSHLLVPGERVIPGAIARILVPRMLTAALEPPVSATAS
jgi:ubiquinone biosynthesis protein